MEEIKANTEPVSAVQQEWASEFTVLPMVHQSQSSCSTFTIITDCFFLHHMLFYPEDGESRFRDFGNTKFFKCQHM